MPPKSPKTSPTHPSREGSSQRQQLMAALRAAVEHYFSEEYLFEPENSYFRDCVSPVLGADEEKEDAADATPLMSCTSLLNLPNIQDALRTIAAEQDAAPAGKSSAAMDELAQAKLIAEAMADSKVVVVVRHDDASSAPSIRRAHPLDPRRDPAHRTVVARPLPVGATLAELAEFFARCGGGGTVERVRQLRQNTNVTAGGTSGSNTSHVHHHSPEAKRVNPFWCAYAVRFATVAEAERAVAAFRRDADAPVSQKRKRDEEEGESHAAAPGAERLPHFGETQVSLAQRFFPPRLYVSPIAEYEATQRQKRKDWEEKQLRYNVLKAQTALTQMQMQMQQQSSNNGGSTEGHPEHGGSASASAAAAAEGIKHYLRKGVTLVVDNVPAGVSWPQVKQALGELSADNARVKGCVRLVHILDDGDESMSTGTAPEGSSRGGRRAFVVCKTPEAAQELATMVAVCDGARREELAKAVPSLRTLTAVEEAMAQEAFPSWCEPKVKRKMQSNQRRPHRY